MDLETYALDFLQYQQPQSVVEWAEANAYISERISEQAGLYSTLAYPYVREVLEAFADPSIKKISLCWGSQTSKTTTCYVGAGWCVDQKPAPILWVWPTESIAKTFATDRLLPFFEDTNTLAARMPKTLDGKIDRDRVGQSRMEFDRCTINLVGGQSKANVRNYPVSYLLLDEIDVIPEPCRREAMDRVKGRRDYKIIQCSTPLEETTGIWGEYLEGDQRRYQIPCPHCGQYIQLNWREGPDHFNIRCDKDAAKLSRGWDYNIVMQTTRYYCQKCDGPIDDAQKALAMRSGRWEAASTTSKKDVRSYHLSSLYSPTLRFGEILTKWLQAQGEVEAVKNFVQGWLAEPWKDELLNVSTERLAELQGTYDRGETKGELRILAVDVQRSHFWWVVRGYDPDGKSYLLDHGLCPTFADLDQAFDQYQCQWAVIDTGYGDRTQEVYEEIWRRRSQWYGVKGWQKLATPYKVNLVDPFTGTGKAGRAKIRLVHIDTTIWQGELAARRAGKVDGWTLYNKPDPQYLRQLTAKWQHEQTNRKGQTTTEWRTKSRADDHYWDCEYYSLAFSKLVGYGNATRDGDKMDSRNLQRNPDRRAVRPQKTRAESKGFWT